MMFLAPCAPGNPRLRCSDAVACAVLSAFNSKKLRWGQRTLQRNYGYHGSVSARGSRVALKAWPLLRIRCRTSIAKAVQVNRRYQRQSRSKSAGRSPLPALVSLGQSCFWGYLKAIAEVARSVV